MCTLLIGWGNPILFTLVLLCSLQALVNSTVTASMNFTKTSPKFGQWSDHRANTVYGLGFSSEKDLQEVLRLRVWGSGYGAQGMGLRVWGSGY